MIEAIIGLLSRFKTTPDGAALVSLASKASGVTIPENEYQFDWLLGDDLTAVTITASGSQSTPAIDVSGYIRDHATVEVVIGGSGTVKMNVQGSRDGVNDLHDLGDRITNMTSGTYILKLDDSNLAYFPYYVFTFTETGGTDSATVKAIIMGRSNDV